MKTWFITGASRGFGALITEAVLATDAVVATARDPSSIPDHPRLLKLPLDVTNEGQARDAAARAIERFGRIDVLVNNAGYGLLGAVEEASATEVERVFATNVFGLLNVTRAVLPYMRNQRSGHVINMSSIGGYASSPGWGVYVPRSLRWRASAKRCPSSLRRSVSTPPSLSPDISARIFSVPSHSAAPPRESTIMQAPWERCAPLRRP
jgi:NAD(P)-dependent dehydrogenase (short-subunit alcohol dehydrogenase family)